MADPNMGDSTFDITQYLNDGVAYIKGRRDALKDFLNEPHKSTFEPNKKYYSPKSINKQQNKNEITLAELIDTELVFESSTQINTKINAGDLASQKVIAILNPTTQWLITNIDANDPVLLGRAEKLKEALDDAKKSLEKERKKITRLQKKIKRWKNDDRNTAELNRTLSQHKIEENKFHTKKQQLKNEIRTSFALIRKRRIYSAALASRHTELEIIYATYANYLNDLAAEIEPASPLSDEKAKEIHRILEIMDKIAEKLVYIHQCLLSRNPKDERVLKWKRERLKILEITHPDQARASASQLEVISQIGQRQASQDLSNINSEGSSTIPSMLPTPSMSQWFPTPSPSQPVVASSSHYDTRDLGLEQMKKELKTEEPATWTVDYFSSLFRETNFARLFFIVRVPRAIVKVYKAITTFDFEYKGAVLSTLQFIFGILSWATYSLRLILQMYQFLKHLCGYGITAQEDDLDVFDQADLQISNRWFAIFNDSTWLIVGAVCLALPVLIPIFAPKLAIAAVMKLAAIIGGAITCVFYGFDLGMAGLRILFNEKKHLAALEYEDPLIKNDERNQKKFALYQTKLIDKQRALDINFFLITAGLLVTFGLCITTGYVAPLIGAFFTLSFCVAQKANQYIIENGWPTWGTAWGNMKTWFRSFFKKVEYPEQKTIDTLYPAPLGRVLSTKAVNSICTISDKLNLHLPSKPKKPPTRVERSSSLPPLIDFPEIISNPSSTPVGSSHTPSPGNSLTQQQSMIGRTRSLNALASLPEEVAQRLGVSAEDVHHAPERPNTPTGFDVDVASNNTFTLTNPPSTTNTPPRWWHSPLSAAQSFLRGISSSTSTPALLQRKTPPSDPSFSSLPIP